jgi:hypothetical protein
MGVREWSSLHYFWNKGVGSSPLGGDGEARGGRVCNNFKIFGNLSIPSRPRRDGKLKVIWIFLAIIRKI